MSWIALEEAVKVLRSRCPDPIVRIECSSKFYKELAVELKEVSDIKNLHGVDHISCGGLSDIPIIERLNLEDPFKLVRFNNED